MEDFPADSWVWSFEAAVVSCCTQRAQPEKGRERVDLCDVAPVLELAQSEDCSAFGLSLAG